MEPARGGRRTGRTARSAVLGAATLALLGWSAALPAAADTVEFTISDSRIDESSGLATDAANERYWTVNDSGDDGIAYALDSAGETEGTLEFRAEPTDVEAVALYDGRLYVADIGDNSERRDFVTVYFFDDAEPGDGAETYKAYDFSYPDGPHDAETLLVDGDGKLFIVTKGDSAGIYAAPSSPSRQGVNALERVGDAPSYVTDGTVLPDGRFALRTYVSIEVIDPSSYEVVARAATPAQKQGESITTTFDGDELLIGSEGKTSKVLRVAVPTSAGEAPTGEASPPSTSSPEPAPDTTDAAEPTEESTVGAGADADTDGPGALSRQGTLAAMGIAAVVAVVAGAVVVLVRRP